MRPKVAGDGEVVSNGEAFRSTSSGISTMCGDAPRDGASSIFPSGLQSDAIIISGTDSSLAEEASVAFFPPRSSKWLPRQSFHNLENLSSGFPRYRPRARRKSARGLQKSKKVHRLDECQVPT